MILSCLYYIGALFLKSALIILYIRIFRPSKKVQVVLQCSIVLVVIAYVVGIVASVSTCAPVVSRNEHTEIKIEDINTSNITDGMEIFQLDNGCVTPLLTIAGVISIFSVITDFYVLIVPIGLILSTRLPPQRKLGICAIFLTGLL